MILGSKRRHMDGRSQHRLTSLLENSLPQPLDLPALLRASASRVEQPSPGIRVLRLDRLLGRLDAHAALLVHGDGGAVLEIGALGDEGCCQTWVAGLQDEIVERLFGERVS